MTKRKYPEGQRGYDMEIRDRVELTELQNRYIDAYTSGKTMYNGVKSALQAGYKGGYSSASRSSMTNLRNPRIARAINVRLQAIYAAADLTVETVLAHIEEARRLAMRKGRYTAAIRASELQGKYLKMFVDRIEHMHKIEDASTPELVNMLKAVVGNVPGLGYNELMESLSGSSATSGDSDRGPAESGGADREGTASTD